MDIIERLFTELATSELRKGAGLGDAARDAMFRMKEDMPVFVACLAEVKAAAEAKPAKAKKGKADKVDPEPGPEAEIVDIEASLEPTAE